MKSLLLQAGIPVLQRNKKKILLLSWKTLFVGKQLKTVNYGEEWNDAYHEYARTTGNQCLRNNQEICNYVSGITKKLDSQI